ncbi:MAG TPA: zinc-ribbon domain-containing protein [Verrucomicrobiota bacterium]|nr:zinc-ribbon domain-containing protein [Verrucomicrobiota bacterium]
MASPPEICPNCGALVPETAQACPECGADEETGWNDTALEQRLGIADPDDFDAEEWAREEAGEARRRPLAALWWITATLLLLAVVGLLVRGYWWH